MNAEKLPEIERRREAAERAEEHHQLFGQIRITPEYIAMAVHVCNFLTINVYVSAYEADPQVAYIAMELGVTPMTGDSDLILVASLLPGQRSCSTFSAASLRNNFDFTMHMPKFIRHRRTLPCEPQCTAAFVS